MRTTDKADFSELDKMYDYLDSQNETNVKKYLQGKLQLASMLEDAPRHIKMYFGEENLSIELINDPCNLNQKKLAVFILTSLSPQQASDKMDDLLLSDWSDTYGEFMDDLLVTVRFMSNETMPGKILIDESISGVPVDGMCDYDEVEAQWPYHYTRTDTIPDIAELQRQNAVLKKFARSTINENCFGYDGEIDGASAQDQAANCGLITPSTVTREMIDEWERTGNYPSGDFEPGDTIYYFSDWMKAPDD